MTAEQFKRNIQELHDKCKKSIDRTTLHSRREMFARTAALIAAGLKNHMDRHGLNFDDSRCVDRYSEGRSVKLHAELVRKCKRLLNALTVVYAMFPRQFSDFNLQYAVNELKNQLSLESADDDC